MTGSKVKVGNKWLSLEGIAQKTLPSGLSNFETDALQFCHEWLGGRETFEFFTSGSTGKPKQIIFRREQLVASARLTANAIHLQRDQNALVCLDTKLVAGAMMLVRSLVTDMNMIIQAPTANPLKGISEQIDFAALVPLQVATMLAHDPAQLRKIGTIIIGGAPLSQDLKDQLSNFPFPVYATYGMTETITHIALQKLNGLDRRDSFQCLPGININIDERGCLVIHAAHLGSSPVITNDLVTILDEKQFRWIGRLDRVINSGGVKVSAEKVEAAAEGIIRDIFQSSRFFVAGIPDEKLGEQVALVLEGSKLGVADQERIKNYLAGRLNRHEIPRTFLSVPSFQETPSQKVDRIGTLFMLLRK